MSRKATFSAAVTAVLAATMLITGQAFAATPTPDPVAAETARPAADQDPAPVAVPAEARRPRAVRGTPSFTG